jgi:hypothetical protein
MDLIFLIIIDNSVKDFADNTLTKAQLWFAFSEM